METLRKTVATFGVVPVALVVLGLLVTSKYSKLLVVVGALWGLSQVLYSVRKVDVTATVTAEDPEITYHANVPFGAPAVEGS